MEKLKELLDFLEPNQRLDLKCVAITNVLSLTGLESNKDQMCLYPEFIKVVVRLTQDKENVIAKDAVLSLINLTAENKHAIKIVDILTDSINIFEVALRSIIDENNPLADPWAMVLSNVTRVKELANSVIQELEKDGEILTSLLTAFAVLNYNKKGSKLHYIASILCNITVLPDGRRLLCDPNYNRLDKLLPFLAYEENVVRRGGVVGVLKNISFDPSFHDIILGESGILTSLLYPLIGSEEYSDEENDKFPLELQYLGEDKKRESDPDLRKMLLESLLQLCSTRKSREILRVKGTYEILREYHKWEIKFGQSPEAIVACENVVDILIKKEEEIGVDNLKNLEIPKELEENFNKQDVV